MNGSIKVESFAMNPLEFTIGTIGSFSESNVQFAENSARGMRSNTFSSLCLEAIGANTCSLLNCKDFWKQPNEIVRNYFLVFISS